MNSLNDIVPCIFCFQGTLISSLITHPVAAKISPIPKLVDLYYLLLEAFCDSLGATSQYSFHTSRALNPV